MSNAAKTRNLKNLDKLIASETTEMAEHKAAGRLHMVLACRNALKDLAYRRELMAAR